MNYEPSMTAIPVGKRKVIVLELPKEGWEKLSLVQTEIQQKIPGITHDMIVSAWVMQMLQNQPAPSSTVEVGRDKLNEENPS